MAGKWRRGIVPALFLVILILFTVKINQTEKIPLVETAGYSFEKGVVTQILEDNIEEDGTRMGQQTIMVRMTTGDDYDWDNAYDTTTSENVSPGTR